METLAGKEAKRRDDRPEKMIDEKKKDLLKKLQALAERGVGGEKEGAQKKLKQLMKKYNIEEVDLSEDIEEDHDFRYHDEFEMKILHQLFYKIVPEYRKKAYTYKYGVGSKSTYGIVCTKAQALQIQIEYEFYRELWKEEVWFFMSAFIQKHNIFPPTSEAGKQEIDKETAMRMIAMMNGMKDKSITPMIEGDGEE